MHRTFPDLATPLMHVFLWTEGDPRPVIARPEKGCGDCWHTDDASLTIVRHENSDRFSIDITATKPVRQAILRWSHAWAPGTRMMGDAWERSYGELEWRGFTPHRTLPWYLVANDGSSSAGYGVQTGAASIACWQADGGGLTLSLDLRSGGAGVVLESRVLRAATVVQRPPVEGESAFAATRGLCAGLCPGQSTPPRPIVGHNDWYWLYGKNSEELILEATRRFMSLYPKNTDVVPWSVIDDGWQTPAGHDLHVNGGPWINRNPGFPDMPGLACRIKELGARPGIWVRPLNTKGVVPASWESRKPRRPSKGGTCLDPSLPEVLDLVRRDIARLREWGFEMIKYDFTTFDVTGLWGVAIGHPMGFAPDGWTLADNRKTTAEVLVNLYQNIRDAAGPDVLLIGCNTVGHLIAGLAEIQRIGDDTSATDWDRTRRMGVNTLAFRAPQQGTLFAADADCVPVSPHVSPKLTRQWLDLVARSGTPLFLSMDPAACDARMQDDIRRALEAAVRTCAPAEPLDWFDSAIPSRWMLQGVETRYDWNEWTD